MLGVRLPKLRALAKELAGQYEAYLAEPCGELFEEVMLRGMVIGCMKCPTEQRLQYIRDFIPLIDRPEEIVFQRIYLGQKVTVMINRDDLTYQIINE